MLTEKELEEKYPIPKDVEDIFEKAGDALVNVGGSAEVLETCLTILDKYPDHPRILNAVGKAYRAVGDSERAREYFMRITVRTPDYVYAYSNISLLYSETGDFEEAERYARRAIKLFNISPIPWNTLGVCFATKGETRRALDHFLAAYGYDPGFCKAAYNIACCYSLLGEKDKAIEYLASGLDTKRRIELAETDSGLDNIRGLREFERIVEEAKKKLGSVEKNEG